MSIAKALQALTARLPWLLFIAAVIGATINLLVSLRSGSDLATGSLLGEKIGFGWLLPVFYTGLGALIISRRPRNRIGWLLIVPGLASSGLPLLIPASAPAKVTLGLWLLLWADNWSWIPIIFPIFLIPLHFPSGRPPSPGWNWVIWFAIFLWLLFMGLMALLDSIGPFDGGWSVVNPIGFIPVAALEGTFLIFWGIGLITVVSASVASLVGRYRRAGVAERQQLKWFLYAGVIFAVIYAIAYFESDTDEFGSVGLLLNLLFVASLLLFPVTITIAILRHGLFDIDIIIRKTAVYTVVSALLALMYFGSVVVLQSVFATAVGEESPLVIVLSTLIIAALFTPVRRRVQATIDRRFYRKKYDAQLALAQFAALARDEVALGTITDELAHIVQESMEPASLTIWLNQ